MLSVPLRDAAVFASALEQILALNVGAVSLMRLRELSIIWSAVAGADLRCFYRSSLLDKADFLHPIRMSLGAQAIMPQAVWSVYENLSGGFPNSFSRLSLKLENFTSVLAVEKHSLRMIDGDRRHELRKSAQIFREHGSEIPLNGLLL